MEKFLNEKNKTVDYLKTLGEFKSLELIEDSQVTLNLSVIIVLIFGALLAILNGALGLG